MPVGAGPHRRGRPRPRPGGPPGRGRDAERPTRLVRALAGTMPEDMCDRRPCGPSRPTSTPACRPPPAVTAITCCWVRDLFRPHCWQSAGPPGPRRPWTGPRPTSVGTHDFTSFCKAASLKDDGNLCAVDLCSFDWLGDSAIFHVRANRFLHHMVRNLVGTLVEIGQGRRPGGDGPGDPGGPRARPAPAAWRRRRAFFSRKSATPTTCWIPPGGNRPGPRVSAVSAAGRRIRTRTPPIPRKESPREVLHRHGQPGGHQGNQGHGHVRRGDHQPQPHGQGRTTPTPTPCSGRSAPWCRDRSAAR